MRLFIEANPKRVIKFMEDPHKDIGDYWDAIASDIFRMDNNLRNTQFFIPKHDRMLQLYRVFFPNEFELWEHVDEGFMYFKPDSYYECHFDERWQWFAEWLGRRHPEIYGDPPNRHNFIRLCERMGYKENKKPEAIQQPLF